MPPPTDPTNPFVDLNAAFGKALLQQFFEPILSGRGANGEAYYAPSGVALLAQQLFAQQSTLILDKVWEHIDVDVLATKVADEVTAALLRPPSTWSPNPHRDELLKRVQDYVALQLGQRVVDQLDLQLGPKQLPSADTEPLPEDVTNHTMARFLTHDADGRACSFHNRLAMWVTRVDGVYVRCLRRHDEGVVLG